MDRLDNRHMNFECIKTTQSCSLLLHSKFEQNLELYKLLQHGELLQAQSKSRFRQTDLLPMGKRWQGGW